MFPPLAVTAASRWGRRHHAAVNTPDGGSDGNGVRLRAACAIADGTGRAALVVTEGLLARLTRAQLEAVVGHEAAHIASGDSVATGVFCSLFALHEETLKHLAGAFDEFDWGGRLPAGALHPDGVPHPARAADPVAHPCR